MNPNNLSRYFSYKLLRISHLGNSRELITKKTSSNKIKHLMLQCNLHRSSLFIHGDMSLQYPTPNIFQDTPQECSNFLYNSLSMVVPAPISLSCSLLVAYAQKLNVYFFFPSHMNFLPLTYLSWLTQFPKLIVLSPNVPNKFGMWPLTPTLLHVFNDWIWEHSIRN